MIRSIYRDVSNIFLIPKGWGRSALILGIFLWGCLIGIDALFASGFKGYYRFPDIHENRIVFTAEGDLWIVSAEGGAARRLTTYPSIEWGPKFSLDGSTIAFSANYEGPREIYTIPLEGGIPKRRTYGSQGCRVAGWTPDGKLIYRSYHLSTLPNPHLILLDTGTGKQEPIPLEPAASGIYDQSGQTLFFTRTLFSGSHTKRYKGGEVEQIWRFKNEASEAIPLTQSYAGISRAPMWWKDRVYFASDRDGTMNIWSMNEDGEDINQHTFHKGWDVKDPSLGQGRIVYQLGADIHIFDISSGRDREIPITLVSDFDRRRERWIKKPMNFITSYDLSPEGDSIGLISRGRAFVLPVKSGRLVEITQKQGVLYKNASFMPDGENLLVKSDETGEPELWLAPINGEGPFEKLTVNSRISRFSAIPSPNGKWAVFTDTEQRLWILDIKEKTTKMIDRSDRDHGYIPYHSKWSPDSRWLAFVKRAENTHGQIYIYGIENKKITPVTSDRIDSYNPVWSPDGKWIYFLSDRHFESATRSPWGHRQPEPFFYRTAKIYHLAIQKGQQSPFLPKIDLEDADKKSEDKKSKTNRIEIDFEGIERRLYTVPVEAADYRGLSMTDTHLYVLEGGTKIEPVINLVAIKISEENVKKTSIIRGVDSYVLSWDRNRLLVKKGNHFYVFKASGRGPGKLLDHSVDISKWIFSIDPREEWRQIFVNAWRMQRDYFYDTNLHGIDWQEAFDRHRLLVGRVTDRYELNDLIGQMVGEIGALHMYVYGGDRRQGENNISIASLGAVFEKDTNRGGHLVKRIYQGNPDYPEKLSPLARPEVDVKTGDVIVSVNGVNTSTVDDLSELMKNQASRQVLLRIKTREGRDRSVIVKPMNFRQNRNLRYEDWEYSRRMQVEKEGKGAIGYIHLRSMRDQDMAQWTREYYPVFNRAGLIIDVRHNQGGNIATWILSKLLKKAWHYLKHRGYKTTWNMQYAFRGHIAVLCNEKTISNGENFAEGFKRLGLGRVIGTRTAGAMIWIIPGYNRLVDGGTAIAPRLGVYGYESEWLIEGHGVEPDVMVDNLPHATFEGKDAQLEAAIEYLKKKIKENPIEVPGSPPPPVKVFDYGD